MTPWTKVAGLLHSSHDPPVTNTTEPVFVVGTGRNGTRSIFRMLRGNPRIEAHHEYGCENIQKIACLFSMDLLRRDQAIEAVRAHYASAIRYSEKAIWLDSSNKASWVIDLLKEAFPRSRFIHLTRDPRRVVPSYYYKLREEMYDDKSVVALAHWIDAGCPADLVPPSEKKYWWRLQLTPDHKVSSVEHQRSRFERCCVHWDVITRTIEASFARLDPATACTVRLEDLITDPQRIRDFLTFLGLDHSPFYYEFLQKPRNVFLPLEFNCTPPQLETLMTICGEQAATLGYRLTDPIPSVDY
jgi:Sulfotransferase family